MKRFIFIVVLLGAVTFKPATAQERKLHELTPQFVTLNSDAARTSVLGGLNYTLKAFEDWWWSAEVLMGKVVLDSNANLGFTSGDLLVFANTGPVYSMPIRLGLTDSAWQADFYTSAGFSWMSFGPRQTYGAYFGGGIMAQTPIDWLGLRADVKNFFYKLGNPNGSSFNSDLDIALGFSVLF